MLQDEKHDEKLFDGNPYSEVDQGFKPVLETTKDIKWYKKLIYALMGIGGIYGLAYLAGRILSFMDPGPQKSGIANFVVYGALFLILAGMAAIDFKKFINEVKLHRYKGFVFGLAFGGGIIFTTMLYSVISSFFYKASINENEQGLRAFIGYYPVLSILILGMAGPFCEEMTYRLGLFSIFGKHKWLGYIVSVTIFALAHFTFNSEDMTSELVNLPVYIMSGVALAIAYDKFGFFCSLTAHMTNNLYSVIMLLLVQYLYGSQIPDSI